MIVNLRGTSGSGKTTVARRIIEENKGEPIMGMVPFRDTERIVGYQVGNLWIPGSYVNVCGGVDTFSWKGAANYLEEKVRAVAGAGYHVLFEGLVQTSGEKRWGGVADDFPFTWAFLDTPEEVCIQRVLQRNGGRVGKNDWYNLRSAWTSCVEQRASLKISGRQVLIINWEKAYEQVVELLQCSGWKS